MSTQTAERACTAVATVARKEVYKKSAKSKQVLQACGPGVLMQELRQGKEEKAKQRKRMQNTKWRRNRVKE